MRLDPAGTPLLNRKRRSLRMRYLAAAASGLVVLVSAGCSATGGSASAVSATITIAAVPGIDNAPLYLAQSKGYFSAAGLQVKVQPYASVAQALSAIQSGKAQIAAGDYGDIFHQQSESADLQILADGYDATAGSLEVLTGPRSSIISPQALKGKTIGIPDEDMLSGMKAGVPASIDAAAASSVLSDYLGLDAADLVTWKPMSEAQEVSELQAGTIPAILVSEPYIYQAESKFGAVEVLDACSGGTANLPLLGYVATTAWIKQNGKAVTDFQAALSRAQSEASIDGPIQQVLRSSDIGMNQQEAELVSLGTYPTSTSANNLDRVERMMVNDGMLQRQVNVSAMIVR